MSRNSPKFVLIINEVAVACSGGCYFPTDLLQ
jgi:hypothetical protein